MFNKINISIPQPCQENWQEMSLEEKGRFCINCQKTVFDFTKSTDKEIILHLKNEKNTCGRLLSTQLNRNLIESNKKSSSWSILFTSAISFIGIGTQNAISQTKQETIQTDKKDITVNDSIPNPNLTHKIKGIVSDEIGPLAGAYINIKGTTRGASANFDGEFEIEAKLGDLLIINYTGKEIIELIITTENSYNIFMTDNLDHVTTGIVAGGLKRQSFFGRQIHKIRNWFR